MAGCPKPPSPREVARGACRKEAARPWRAAKPPLCKGRWHGAVVPEGLSPCQSINPSGKALRRFGNPSVSFADSSLYTREPWALRALAFLHTLPKHPDPRRNIKKGRFEASFVYFVNQPYDSNFISVSRCSAQRPSAAGRFQAARQAYRTTAAISRSVSSRRNSRSVRPVRDPVRCCSGRQSPP